MLRSYLLVALRNLQRQKFFSALNILGLSLGLAASLLLVKYISYEWSYDRFHSNADRIYGVSSGTYPNENGYAVTSPLVAPALQANFPEVVAAARIFPTEPNVTANRGRNIFHQKVENALYANHAFLKVFDFGCSPGASLLEPLSTVISEDLAFKLFGTTDVIGKSLAIKGMFESVYTITGTFGELPGNSMLQFELLVSDHPFDQNMNYYQGWRGFFTFLLLEEGANPDNLEAQFPELIRKSQGEESREWLRLLPLKDIYLFSSTSFDLPRQGNISLLITMGVIAVFLLLLAWVNYINLATARSLDRAREVGIRKVLGSNRRQLVTQFMAESLVLNLVAMAIALGLVQLCLPAFNKLVGHPAGSGLLGHADSTWIWLLAMGVVLMGSFGAGIYPAFILSRFKPIQTLKGKFSHAKQGMQVRRGLVVLQFFVAAVLLMATFTVYQQISYMRSQQLGIEIAQTLIIDAPVFQQEKDSLTGERFRRAVQQMPAVTSFLHSATVPALQPHNYGTTAWRPEGDSTKPGQAMVTQVGEGYFEHFGIQLLSGNDYSTPTAQKSGALLINESLRKQLGFSSSESAVGKRIRTGNRVSPQVIQGVVSDFHSAGLQSAINPSLFQFAPTGQFFSLHLSTTGHELANVVKKIETVYTNLFPAEPFEYTFLDQAFEKEYQQDRRFGMIFGLFTGLTLLIACLGLLGLSAFSAAQRTRELSIRKVMGATATDLWNLLTKEFLTLVILANLLAWPVAWWLLSQWLDQYAYHISFGIGLAVVPAMLMLAIALSAVSYQSWRAARVDPAKSLKYE
ncbi:MAG: ABC transporter permease [Bacteroidota bacterium]